MRPFTRFLGLLSPLALLGCSAADLINFATPRGGYSLRTDIPYGEGPRRMLDLYRPDRVAKDSPVVVFIYGGGWNSGRKGDYLFAGQALASRGYVTAIPDYRVYPEVKFPDFVDDAARAVAWIAAHRGDFDAAGRPIILVGHSAGAQIALLLTLDRRYLAAAGAPVCAEIAGAVGMAGPYDFLPLKEERYKRVFPEATRADSQPINFVDGHAPPVLLLVGDADTTVDPGNTARLAERIATFHGRVETRTYPGIGHIGLVGALARPFRGRASVLDDIDRFIRAQSGRRPPSC